MTDARAAPLVAVCDITDDIAVSGRDRGDVGLHFSGHLSRGTPSTRATPGGVP